MNISCVGTFSLSHFIINFSFHILLCISAVVSPLAFHMSCCISISILVFACHYEWSLSHTNHYISDFTSHYSSCRPSLWISVFILHHTLGGLLPLKNRFFTTYYGFSLLHFIMHLIFHNSLCIFPIALHDSLFSFASYFILPLWS